MSAFTLSTTQKKKPLLLCKDFGYVVEQKKNEKTYWKCEYAGKMKCQDRVHTDPAYTTLLFENDNHNHLDNAVSAEIRTFEEKIRDQAITCNENIQAVIDTCLTNLSNHAVAHLPNFKHIKRNIQHQRVKNDLPSTPHDKTFDQIPVKLTMIQRDSLFLQFDSGPGNDRTIIFSSIEQLKILESGVQLLVDGTSKVSKVDIFLFINIKLINISGYSVDFLITVCNACCLS